MGFQLETRGGRGVCLPKPGLDATCAQVTEGDWFWATAEFPARTVIINSARPGPWVVEKYSAMRKPSWVRR
ncbi:MAG: hypothetical protein AAFX99_19940 [Myxococcota bacterium]